MSNFASESAFIGSPSLHQAERLARTNPPETEAEDLQNDSNLERQYSVGNDEYSSEELMVTDGGLTDGPLTLSPTEDNVSFATRLGTLSGDSSTGYRSQLELIHPSHDVSENPLFSVRSGFRYDSMANTNDLLNITSSAQMSPAEGPSRRSTENGSLFGTGSQLLNSSLPEDDGMGAMRRAILEIQSKGISIEEKAHLMHQLLTRNHRENKKSTVLKGSLQGFSLPEMISQERPMTSGSLSSFLWQMNGILDTPLSDEYHTFHLSPEDIERTYAPILETDDDGEAPVADISQILGCKHYQRNVKLQCSTCHRWYTCRLCHDEAEDHVLIRNATENMLCMLCSCAQPAGEFCAECGERAAWYYCNVCKLWDNDASKNIYHCNDCGICRKGLGLGKDFFHCKTCGVCMSMSQEYDHKCIERVSDCDCPICGEYLFTSPKPVVFMRCGHTIHQACYWEHMQSSYKCPICSKSTVNMETQFHNLQRAIDAQPMPPQFQDTKAIISCNDCSAKTAVKYHWLGLQCAICHSYNTVQLSIITDPPPEAAIVEEETRLEISIPPNQTNTDTSPLADHVLHRRYSSHTQPTFPNLGNLSLPPQRTTRSVSPMRGRRLLDEPPTDFVEANEQEAEDVSFWGGDEPQSDSFEKIGDDRLESDQDDEDDASSISMSDEYDDDDDEEDRFQLIGHR